jgi:hypothetical protein
VAVSASHPVTDSASCSAAESERQDRPQRVVGAGQVVPQHAGRGGVDPRAPDIGEKAWAKVRQRWGRQRVRTGRYAPRLNTDK